MKPAITKAVLSVVAFMFIAISPAQAQQPDTRANPQEDNRSATPLDAVSTGDVEKMVAEVSRRITPFHLEDARDGFKKEFDSKDNALNSSFGVGAVTSMTIAKPRSTGGRTSVEIFSKSGKLDTIAFKILEGSNSGFSAIWNAKPAVILSGPVAADTSSSIGFTTVTLVNGEVATEYKVIGPNKWSVSTHPYK